MSQAPEQSFDTIDQDASLPLPTGFPAEPKRLIREYLHEIDRVLAWNWLPHSQRENVLSDLQSQILEMLVGRLGSVRLEDCLPEDVATILGGMDPPQRYADTILTNLPEEERKLVRQSILHQVNEAKPSGKTDQELKPGELSGLARAYIWFAGVILPSITLIVELYTHMCAEAFFDPIPTLLHVFLVVLVPLTSLALLIKLPKKNSDTEIRSDKVFSSRNRVIAAFTGLSFGISFIYAIAFLPILPMGAVMVIAFGLGLLPLAPVLSAFVMLKLFITVRRLVWEDPVPRRILWVGLALGIALPISMAIPGMLTATLVDYASSEEPETRDNALSWIRWLGSEDKILQMCYGAAGGGRSRGGSIMDVGGNSHVPAEKARTVYYRLTGRPFNSVPPPARIQKLWRGASFNVLDLDPENRDQGVGAINSQLSLKGSRLDGVTDAKAGFGYLEWTMTFHNHSSWQQEARSHVKLPPGGVVSRVTLWINDEEREAAFASTSRVKEAYEKVVARRQDPVLVTTAGGDQVMVQCFPVPPNGDMKTRIGITFPLPLSSKEQASLFLPKFAERNFSISKDTKHLVWIESTAKIDQLVTGLAATPSPNNGYQITGPVAESDLNDSGSMIVGLSSDTVATSVTLPDFHEPERYVIKQRIQEIETSIPARLILVVDGSEPMQERLPLLSKALQALPKGLELKLVIASDRERSTLQAASASHQTETIVRQLEALDCVGGQDSVPALVKAWNLAAEVPNSAIVWAHGAQPVQLSSPDGLLQLVERSRYRPVIYDMSLGKGRNVIASQLDRSIGLTSMPHSPTGQPDLATLVGSWDKAVKRYDYRRERVERTAADSATTSTRYSGHLSRLWARDAALELFHQREVSVHQKAVKLAVKYQLVTPMTGAVVLENKSQYEEAGLKPVDPSTVPTIPEPEEWLLMSIVAGLLIIYWFRKKSADSGGGLSSTA